MKLSTCLVNRATFSTEIVLIEIWKKKFKCIRTSKKSLIIGDILNQLSIKYEVEKNIGSKFVDYFLTDYNISIEYFGDYWHCNPKKFESNYYNSQLKAIASDLWKRDKERLDKIRNEVDSIIIVWESSEINSSILEKTIREIKNKKTIIYI